MNASVDRSGNRVGGASRSSESPKPRTDGRTDGLTKNLLTERTSGTFRNAHTRVPDFASGEVPETDTRSEVERLRERGDTYLGALRILGSQVRALRAKLEERS